MFSIKFNVVNSFIKTMNVSPANQVALGFVLGMFLGLIPFSLNSFIISFLLFILNVDSLAGVISAALFGLIGFLIDPLAHIVGYQLLVNIGFLKPLWSAFYNMPFIPFTRFNNTIVMGNTAIGLLLAIPVYFAIKAFINYFRTTKGKAWLDNIAQSKFMKFWKMFDILGNLKNKFDVAKND